MLPGFAEGAGSRHFGCGGKVGAAVRKPVDPGRGPPLHCCFRLAKHQSGRKHQSGSRSADVSEPAAGEPTILRRQPGEGFHRRSHHQPYPPVGLPPRCGLGVLGESKPRSPRIRGCGATRRPRSASMVPTRGHLPLERVGQLEWRRKRTVPGTGGVEITSVRPEPLPGASTLIRSRRSATTRCLRRTSAHLLRHLSPCPSEQYWPAPAPGNSAAAASPPCSSSSFSSGCSASSAADPRLRLSLSDPRWRRPPASISCLSLWRIRL